MSAEAGGGGLALGGAAAPVCLGREPQARVALPAAAPAELRWHLAIQGLWLTGVSARLRVIFPMRPGEPLPLALKGWEDRAEPLRPRAGSTVWVWGRAEVPGPLVTPHP